jgi:hypothetical protein
MNPGRGIQETLFVVKVKGFSTLNITCKEGRCEREPKLKQCRPTKPPWYRGISDIGMG